jgi:uncharacterized protein (DUF433 family)
MDSRRLKPSEIKLLPAYPLAEAARYLGSNPSTLGTWFKGRNYKVKGQTKRATAVLSHSGLKGEPISFLDLIEAHILLAIRKSYGIPLKRFRAAMEFLREAGDDLHFLARREFSHDRRDLFLRWENKLVSLSERGQLVDKEIISEGLKQITYGDDGYAARFYPRQDARRQESIVLDPTINFGKPCLIRSGVGVDAIAARFVAGERIADLANDYAATREEIEEAIRWHELFAK